MSRIYTVLLAAFVSLLLTLPGAAQDRGSGRSGQTSGSIVGTILEDETGDPIETATVAVWSASDSTLVTGAVSDPSGRFEIEGLRAGSYYLEISFIGFETATIRDIGIDGPNDRADVGAIRLRTDTELLDEVEITAEREFMEFHVDRNVYNVQDQPITSGGSATDVLRNIPSVEVDIDGNVSLRGNQNVAILINGRPAQMNAEMLASFLESLPANTIERIEVIPNPSARYDPDGMSGILNIVLRRDSHIGLNGSLSVNADNLGSYGGSAMAGYGSGPLNLRATYGFRSRESESSGDRFNEYRLHDPLDFMETENEVERFSDSHSLNLSTDYRLTRNSTLSAFGMASLRGGGSDEITRYATLDEARSLTSRYDRMSIEDDDDLNLDFGLSFQRIPEAGRRELVAEIRYEHEREDELEDFRRELVSGVPPEFASPTLETERTARGEIGNEFSAQVDYLRPLGQEGKVETGIKSTFDGLDSDFFSERFDPALSRYVPDVSVINAFRYTQLVNGAYVIVGQQYGKIGVQLGLRAEAAFTTFDLTTTGESFDNDYFSLFPNGYVTYNFDDVHRLRGSYSKRINRPRTWSLNPFTDMDDPLYRRVGNPYLKPEYTHSFELSYSRTGELTTFTVSPYFRRTIDEISRFQTVDEFGVTTLTFQNFASSDSWGVEAITSLRIGEWFQSYVSFNAYRVVTDGTNVENSLSNDALGWMSRANATIKVLPSLDLQLSYFYRAPMNIENGRIQSFSRSNVALRQQFSGRRASLSVRLEDPLNMSGFGLWRETSQFYLETNRRWESRSVSLTFTYNFGRQERQRQRDREVERDLGEDGPDVDFD